MIVLTDDLHDGERIRVNPMFVVAYRSDGDGASEVYLANFESRETPILVRETPEQIDKMLERGFLS